MAANRPYRERAEAVGRLALDGPLLPVRELAAFAGLSPKGLERWIIQGRSGTYLDGVKNPELGWCSTTKAVLRAAAARAAKLSQSPAH